MEGNDVLLLLSSFLMVFFKANPAFLCLVPKGFEQTLYQVRYFRALSLISLVCKSSFI